MLPLANIFRRRDKSISLLVRDISIEQVPDHLLIWGLVKRRLLLEKVQAVPAQGNCHLHVVLSEGQLVRRR